MPPSVTRENLIFRAKPQWSVLWSVPFNILPDEEYGEKSVSVSLDGQEAELLFIDHPSTEMSVGSAVLYCTVLYCTVLYVQVENTMSTYEPAACVVVYSVTDRLSYARAEDTLQYLASQAGPASSKQRALILVSLSSYNVLLIDIYILYSSILFRYLCI